MGWQEYTQRLRSMETRPSTAVKPKVLNPKDNICTCRKEEAQ